MIENLKNRVKNKINDRNISFWFVRHGESEGNELGDTCPLMHDTPLNNKGKKESQEIVEYLQKNNIKITSIYTAPKGRSRETAEIIGKGLVLSVKIKNNLSERNWGNWKALRWMEASERLEKFSVEERYLFIPEDGESWQEMEMRLFTVLEEIADEHLEGENILIVTHQGCLRAIMPMLAQAGRDKHKEFSVATGSLSKFSFEKDKFDFVGFIPKALVVFISIFSNFVR